MIFSDEVILEKEKDSEEFVIKKSYDKCFPNYMNNYKH